MSVSGTMPSAPASADSAWAFQGYICYSHRDKQWAAWLQRAIEWYVVPRKLRGRRTPQGIVGKRCGTLFRDRTEAHADAHLYQLLFEALDSSKNLLVICSPAAAASKYCNDEIRHFRHSGRADRVFCLIVDGDPDSLDPVTRAYPPALLEQLPENDGPVVPLAADVRPGSDGKRDAMLKIAAAMLGVRFDELRRRDRDQRRRQLAAAFTAAAAFAVALFTAYYFALLAGQHPPGYKLARQQLQQRGWILLVPIPGAHDVAEAGSSLRQRVTAALWSKGERTKWRWHDAGEVQSRLDPWTIGQALSGLLGSSDLPQSRREVLLAKALLLPVRVGGPVERNGVKYGWYGYDPQHQVGETWPEEGLWYASALSRALALPPSALGGSRRHDVADALDYTQRSNDTYRDPQSGGWDAVADQLDKTSTSTYTTATALQALLDAKRAGVGWLGDAAKRDKLIGETAARLVRGMRPIGTRQNRLQGLWGWNGSVDDENPFEEGVTLQVFAMLLRAEAEAGYPLPPRIASAIPPHLERIGTANYAGIEGATSSTAHFREDVRGVGSDESRSLERSIDFAWYPWAVACSELWLQRAATHPDAAASAISARRALGHLLVDLGDDAAGDASYEHPWAAAELLVNLNLVPFTQGDLEQLGFR